MLESNGPYESVHFRDDFIRCKMSVLFMLMYKFIMNFSIKADVIN